MTDDGVRCPVKYNCIRWDSRDLPPQAGIGIYERGPDGRRAAARVYDDVEAPTTTPEGRSPSPAYCLVESFVLGHSIGAVTVGSLPRESTGP